jgi:hypothetical protein
MIFNDSARNSPNALNVTKTSRLRYAGHMIRRPKDLPQKALFKVKPNGRRKTEIQVGRWGEKRWPGPRGQRLDALCSRQAVMERSSSTGLNQVLVVVTHK